MSLDHLPIDPLFISLGCESMELQKSKLYPYSDVASIFLPLGYENNENTPT